MRIIETRNVNTAYEELMLLVSQEAIPVNTRNGAAMAMPHPVFVHFTHPEERVLFDEERNANPFFHLVEAMWMLAGRNDVKFIKNYNSQMELYSDDGITFNAAYGHRWRKHFGYDQVIRVCDMLRENPDDRRCVLAMWDGTKDLGEASKDLPCNVSITCRIVAGALDFTITNRSNDLVFGLCGANAVHMSILQEYMARRIGVKTGQWYHLSNNLHVYERHYPLLYAAHESRVKLEQAFPYPAKVPLVYDWNNFDLDCLDLVDGRVLGFRDPFFTDTVSYVVRAWDAWKMGDFEGARNMSLRIQSRDWQIACTDWLCRAQEKRNAEK